jgi:hypothetical protein
MGRAERRGIFQTVARRQVLTVRKQRPKRDVMASQRAARESVHRTTERRRRSAIRRGWESIHDTTLATLDEQSGRQVGPTILFDRPRQDPPSLPPSDFPLGWPLCGDESRAEVSWVRRRGGIFPSAWAGRC